MTALYLGIDVSKGYADCVLLDEGKNIVTENFQIDDTYAGHDALSTYLYQIHLRYPEATVYAGLESTGGFEDNFYSHLLSVGNLYPVQVTRLNPRGVMHDGKANLKRVVTDRTSARTIATYLINHPEKAHYNTVDCFASLRKQFSLVTMLTNQRVQLINQLHSRLYVANPGILTLCKDGIPDYVLHVLGRYPTARMIARARVSSLCTIPYLTKNKAAAMIEMAKKSVASAQDDQIARVISSLAREILCLKQTICDHMKFLNGQTQCPEIEILRSFKGIGDLSAIGFLLAIGSIDRFPTVKHFASFFGVHPVFKSSGDGLSGVKMSKQGNPEVRRLLYMVSLAAVDKNPLIKELYGRCLERGMNKQAAIGVMMHKILRIIYGMLKTRTKFDPEVDRRNRQQELPAVNLPVCSPADRLHPLDSSAPISRRQTKMRKERAKSHDGIPSGPGSSTHSFPNTEKSRNVAPNYQGLLGCLEAADTACLDAASLVFEE